MSDNQIDNLFAEASSNAENAEAPAVSETPQDRTRHEERTEKRTVDTTSAVASPAAKTVNETAGANRGDDNEQTHKAVEHERPERARTEDNSRVADAPAPVSSGSAAAREHSSQTASTARPEATTVSRPESVMSATGDILGDERTERSPRIGTDEVMLDEDIASAVVLITQEYSRMTEQQRDIASGLVSGSTSDFKEAKSIGHVVMSFFRVDSLVEPTMDAMITAWNNEPAERVLYILGLDKVLFSSLVSMTEAFGTKIETSEGNREEVKIDTIRQAGRIIGELSSETIEDLKVVKNIISIVPSR